MRNHQGGRKTLFSAHCPDIAIIGRACRLPGANSVVQLWDLLSAATCAVSSIPADRWSLERFGHKRPKERGRSCTWAAGVLDDIWGFDPAVFGISPREAEQMDPQQRLLLELTFEAIEDAGIRPSTLAGGETGVFIGGSSLDYGNLRLHDPCGADAYFATGNTLAILSNRISYVFDLHGPSYTVDTACSSSLVALDAAVSAIASGRIDTAIVGGANALVSPFGFISFSQATMLSPTGLCQAFSAKADGYVRAEGGVVLVLRAQKSARANGDRVHARIVGSSVNSDGRTSGISLPSKANQIALLERAYLEGPDPNRIAFIEAHGTGTRVGDPVEAGAIGAVLGQRRHRPLPIGSIKTNIGHTEPASGLAGVMKAMLALEHDELPPSLHFDEPNPDIAFDELNLSVCTAPLALPRDGRVRFAGVNSFGFGGANAHVTLADPAPADVDGPAAREASLARQGLSRDGLSRDGLSRDGLPRPPQFLLLSAESQDALADLARSYSTHLSAAGAGQIPAIVAATGHRRELHSERLAIPLGEPATLIQALDAAAAGSLGGLGAAGPAVQRAAPVAFVFSGNGSQWPGMGRSAYAASSEFRAHFHAIDTVFEARAGWSLSEMMFSADIAAQLKQTSVAQPLIFAIQAATARCLKALGLVPGVVFGHSMGEIAAAECAGILDLESAVEVVYVRSRHQELVHDAGGLAVVIGPREAAEALTASFPDLSVAAHNSPRNITVAGPAQALEEMARAGGTHKLRVRRLDLAYPFHSALMAPVEAPLRADRAGLRLRKSCGTTFVSTVEARALSGLELGAGYWWRNVREPVRFMESMELALDLGARVFVKIGPSHSLLADVKEIAEHAGVEIGMLSVHHQKPASGDPFRRAVALALTQGAKADPEKAFGDDPGPISNLPPYPWRRVQFRVGETCESTGLLNARPWHPLIGARLSPDGMEWRGQIDPVLTPALADHRIEGHVLLPGAAFAEMALAVARDWLGGEIQAITDLEIGQPMLFPANMSREILCRANSLTGAIEITSRARLSNTPWITHAKAQVVRNTSPRAGVPPVPPCQGENVSGPELYAIARRSGLDFGPAFANAAAAARIDAGTIVVDLLSEEPSEAYGLDPARLDSCFHGLILLFSSLSATGWASAYLPVRFGEIRLEKPGAAIVRARIDVKRCDARAIVADFILVDANGELIASLTGARFQAVRERAAGNTSGCRVVQTSVLADEPTAIRIAPPCFTPQRLARAAEAELALARDGIIPDDVMLIEGWATASAYALAAGLSRQGRIAPEALIAEGKFPAARRGWFGNLLAALEQSGLVKSSRSADGSVSFDLVETSLPDQNDILKAIAGDYPRRSAEILLAARASAIMAALARAEADISPLSQISAATFEIGSAPVVAAAGLLASLLRRLTATLIEDRALRILQIGYGPLSSLAMGLASDHGGRLTIFDPDPRRLELARLAFARQSGITFSDDLGTIPPGSFDLVIAADCLRRMSAGGVSPTQIAGAMASEALFAAIEPAPSLFRDLVFGLSADANSRVDESEGLTAADWPVRLAAAGLQNPSAHNIATAAGPAILISGQMAKTSLRRNVPKAALIIRGANPRTVETADALSRLLAKAGSACGITQIGLIDEAAAKLADALVFIPDAPHQGGTTVDQLAARCLALKASTERLGKQARIWIVCPGALRDAGANPLEAGFWAFSRTLANELPGREVRRIDVDPDLSAEVMAKRLADVILSGTVETDILADKNTTKVVRFRGDESVHAPASWPAAKASRLEKGEGSGLDRIAWTHADRRPPGPGEVEIAVAATGLNFRDVMWGLSILPDEMLEDGFAGATLGLECAGRVVAVGEDVGGFKHGDAVVAFAGGAFASHVTVSGQMVSAIPNDLPFEAAATIPVAFLTAYYALVTCAQLKAGEWVLIHGGAGGVGLAALQIARRQGARVIATAGSAEKCNLAAALGAEHVFDARSGGFVDEVRRVAPEGVAVVLNSLSGEAMERSLALLEPFGRFVELGKRDYLANTRIGLRPFRKNLAYFGVDLDQLILARADKGQQLFREVMDLFAKGELTPLPYRVFPAREHIDAMRLMQQSGHIGKIVVTPPPEGEIRVAPRDDFKISAGKTHLVTGGLRGFGLETARWLVERGARYLVLVSRSGASSPEAQQALAEFTAAGVTVHAAAIDIADSGAVENLFQHIRLNLPPLCGVMHAAAILDDTIIANLDSVRLKKVLAPKVAGAEHLDRMTRDLPLDYFVLFSSATTVIGNPGQSSYVAANGFLEGLARRRRAAGEPALAIAWGAIADAGMLARHSTARETLANRAGVEGMLARTALNLMGEALSRSESPSGEAVLVIGEINWTFARSHLPLLQSPSFDDLVRETDVAEAGAQQKIDVNHIVATRSSGEALKLIADVIVLEIAHILRLPQETLNRTKPLAEIGLDSLMAAELGVKLEERLTLEAPLSASAGSFNVVDLADHILGLCVNTSGREDGAPPQDAVARDLAARHLGAGIDAAALAPLAALVEEKSRDLTKILQ